jgi:pimeloyl-ACP methyl ester carboxylesterase
MLNHATAEAGPARGGHMRKLRQQRSSTHQVRSGRRLRLVAVAAAGLAVVAALAVPVPSVLAATAQPAATSAAANGAVTLPGVGHDASYQETPCPNPIIAAYPILNLYPPEFTCGYLTVPEDRTKPDSPKIKIAVARAAPKKVVPGATPLLWLEGGPGGSGLAAATRIVGKGVNADREVIFVDQRGTLKSDPLLNCPNYDSFLAKAVAKSAENPETGREDAAAVGACYQDWVDQGYDPAAFNTSENAADLADLRIELGIKSWNVYGVSYGTDLALQYLRDYPEGIRSEVLDSVVPPQVNLANQFWPAAADGYQDVAAACEAQPACNAAYPDLRGELTTVVNRLSSHPVTVQATNPVTGDQGTVVLDGYTFANLLVTLSLAPGSFVQAPRLIDEMAKGNAVPAADLVLAGAPLAGVTGYGLAFGVFCSEAVPFTSPAHAESIARQVLPDFPAKVLALTPQQPHLFADCQAWPVPPADPAVTAPVHSDVPVLELSGTFDAITPTAWARMAAETLPNSRIIEFPGDGHGVVNWTDCAATVMVGFLDQPDGGYSTSCVPSSPPPFDS